MGNAKLNKRNATILLLLVAVAAVGGLKYFLESSRGGVGKGVASRSKVKPSAPIKIVEYMDFQCPACAKGAEYLKSCFVKYPDKFYLQMKQYPLGMHRHAMQSARYAHCAAQQGKFWPFHDALVERQKQWESLISADSVFRQFAQEAMVDMKQLDVCLQNERTNTEILEEKEKGASLGVKSTPSYFVNGKMVVGFKSLAVELGALSGQGDGSELVCSQ